MAAYSIPIFQRTFTAAGDLRTNIYALVKLDSTGKVVLAGAGDIYIGVLQTKPNTGESCTVMIDGVTPVNVGTGNLTAGQPVMSDASGRAVTATSGNYAGAVAETSGALNGALATVLLKSLGKI